MNNILISNPFLFRPSSSPPYRSSWEGEVLRTAADYSYQEKQFTETWDKLLEESSSSSSSSALGDLWPAVVNKVKISSPDVTSTLLSPDSLADDISMDGANNDWLSGGVMDLSYEDSPQFYVDETEIAELVQGSGSNDNEVSFESFPNFDSDDIEEVLGDDIMAYKNQANILERDGKCLPTLTQTWTGENIYNQAHTVNAMSMTQIPAIMTITNNNNLENPTSTVDLSMIAPAAPRPNTRQSHSRKATLEERIIAASPAQSIESEQDMDIKPDVTALGINNGQKRVPKKRTFSDAYECDTPGPSSKKNTPRKPRKYELDEKHDPSVKNAKAAKMNREKKKKEREEMENRIQALETSEANLQKNLTEKTNEAEQYRLLYDKERSKNMMADGLSRELTNVKNILEACVPALNNKFNQKMEVVVPETLADVQAYLDNQGNIQVPPTSPDPNNFDILDPEYQMPYDRDPLATASTSTYTQLFISPQENKIHLSYNPTYVCKNKPK